MAKQLNDHEYTATKLPKRKASKDDAEWFVIMQDLALRGISEQSIAARLGISYAEFKTLIEYEYPPGTFKVRDALNLARAEYEISRVLMKDAILDDPDVSASLKAKIIRDDLKVIEAWAPATRAVKVTIEKAVSEFSFESFSDAEQQAIISNAIAGDAPAEITNNPTSTDGD
jgi:hypothetical protein